MSWYEDDLDYAYMGELEDRYEKFIDRLEHLASISVWEDSRGNQINISKLDLNHLDNILRFIQTNSNYKMFERVIQNEINKRWD